MVDEQIRRGCGSWVKGVQRAASWPTLFVMDDVRTRPAKNKSRHTSSPDIGACAQPAPPQNSF